jgi:lipopolysaccharide heptosyltransferase II
MQDTQYKTLVIRFSSVGDIILSSPLVRALRHRFPQMQVDFLVKDTYADLVRSSPHLSHVLTFPDHAGVNELLHLRREIRVRRYDTILDIHASLRSRVLTFGLKDVRRVRKRVIARAILVHWKRDVYSLFGGAPGVARRYLETVAPEGLAGESDAVELFVPPGAHVAAGALLAQVGLPPSVVAIGVCPSARHFTKIWPEERYAEAATALAHEQRLPIFLFGSSEDTPRCRKIVNLLRMSSPELQVFDFSGSCSLPETAVLLDRCRVVLTNDSGLMHMAVARHRPVVAIFGSTVRQLGFFPNGPLQRVVEHPGLSCRPCTPIGRAGCPKGHFRCMLDIPPERIVRTAHELLDGTQTPTPVPSPIS